MINQKQNIVETLPEYNPNFGVYDEWGPLKHCLVGTAETFRFPDNLEEGYDALGPETSAFMEKGAGKLFKSFLKIAGVFRNSGSGGL